MRLAAQAVGEVRWYRERSRPYLFWQIGAFFYFTENKRPSGWMCTRAKRKFVANATVPGVGVPQNKTFLLSLPIRRKEKMTLYDELVARGLIAQVTNEEEIK